MSEPSTLVLNGPGDVVAAMPYLLGTQLDGSVVVMPVDQRRRRPMARADIPKSAEDYPKMAKGLGEYYGQFDGGKVMVLAYTDQLERATAVCDAVANALEPAMTVADRIAAQGDEWVRLGETRPELVNQGTITQADRDRIAVTFISRGDRPPYDSVESLRASFDPTGEDLSEAVETATGRMERAGAGSASAAVEQRWMTHTIEAFVARPTALAPDDAARLIGNVQGIDSRDHAMGLMTQENASAHAALWKDLLTRSPEQARTQVANLAAFGAWLNGDGMSARRALERVTDPSNWLAGLLVRVLDHGLDPTKWSPGVLGLRDALEDSPAAGAGRPGESPVHIDPRPEPPAPGSQNQMGPAR